MSREPTSDNAGTRETRAEIYDAPVITHVVSWKVADPADVEAIRRRLEVLADEIEEIRSLVVGVNVVESPRAHDLVLIATFDDLDALRRYQEHPSHLPVVEFVRTRVAATVAVDFES